MIVVQIRGSQNFVAVANPLGTPVKMEHLDRGIQRPAVNEDAEEQAVDAASEAPEEAVAGFLLLLRRDPNFPFPWVNLGDALAAAGRVDDAEYCFRQAVSLAPRWPPILMRAVNFYFQSGNPKAALPLASEVLNQVEKYDSEIFSLYIGQAQADLTQRLTASA